MMSCWLKKENLLPIQSQGVSSQLQLRARKDLRRNRIFRRTQMTNKMKMIKRTGITTEIHSTNGTGTTNGTHNKEDTTIQAVTVETVPEGITTTTMEANEVDTEEIYLDHQEITSADR